MLAWLLELLPLLLRALLAALAALLTAMVLPPGGVIWRLPPELSYQLGGVGQAHAVLVQLADAALAMIIALVGFGHIASPRAGLQALPPRAVAPRLAVAVLINQGSLAMGAWVIDLHTPCLGAMTPSSLVAFDPGAWVQAGPDGLMLGVLYALAGLLLALGGWPRVALVDVLLVGAPVLAVLWLLPLTADWGEWALRLFGNLLAGQWLQVLALWLGGQMLLAQSPDLGTTLGKGFAALAVLLTALWLPGLLPWPRGLGGLQVLLGFAVARQLLQGVWGQRDRLERDFVRHKELEQPNIRGQWRELVVSALDTRSTGAVALLARELVGVGRGRRRRQCPGRSWAECAVAAGGRRATRGRGRVAGPVRPWGTRPRSAARCDSEPWRHRCRPQRGAGRANWR